MLVLVSSFYTAALEKPFAEALAKRGYNHRLVCVPYNQLHSFLLNPLSFLPGSSAAAVVLLLRMEDFIRLELAQSGKDASGGAADLAPVFRQRTEEFLAILGQISRLRLTVMFCPAGRGAFDIGFLGNAPRVSEHRIAAVLRGQQRHLILSWSDFERATKPGSWFNLAGDRLAHVPFTPEGLNELADFFVGQVERIPNVSLEASSNGSAGLDLKRFLASLKVEVKISRFTPEDEQPVLDLIRHTTHFINLAGRKWDSETLRTLVAGTGDGECWVLRVHDRFGNYGVSGAITFGFDAGAMRIGLLFLSCTVLGKQVEHALFGWMAQVAETRHARCIEVAFAQGPDNHALQALLARLAAEVAATEVLPAETGFCLNVGGLIDRVSAEAPNPAVVPSIV